MDIQKSLEYPLPSMSVNTKEIVMEESDKKYRFTIRNSKGGTLSGRIISPNKSIRFEPSAWEGNRQEVECTFSPEPLDGFKPGDVKTFEALIISNGGELALPVTVKLAKRAITTAEGVTIANLQDFYNYALKHPRAARTLFTDSEFHMLLMTMEFPYLEAYILLSKEPNRARALDNFFILAGLKKKTHLFVPDSYKEHIAAPGNDRMIYGQFVVEKSDNGYVEANISLKNNVPWLSLPDRYLSSGDFKGGLTCKVRYSIDPLLIGGRYAMEKIDISLTDTVNEEVTIDIVFKRPSPIKVKLDRDGYRFNDEGEIIIENRCSEPLEVNITCNEQFVRFFKYSYTVEDVSRIPFIIKLTPLQSAHTLFRKVPMLSAFVNISTNFKGDIINKNLKLTANGEW